MLKNIRKYLIFSLFYIAFIAFGQEKSPSQYSEVEMEKVQEKRLKRLSVMRSGNFDFMHNNADIKKTTILEPFNENMNYYDGEIFHFGFLLGFNFSDLYIKSKLNQDATFSENEGVSPGITLGVVGSLTFFTFVDLKSEISLDITGRSVKYSFRYDNDKKKDNTSVIPSTLMRIPIYLKLRSKRFYNYRTFVTGGVSYVHDWSNHKITVDDGGNKIDIANDDITLDFGLGFDYYSKFAKISVLMKYSAGLINIGPTGKTDYERDIQSMYSSMFSLLFYIEK